MGLDIGNEGASVVRTQDCTVGREITEGLPIMGCRYADTGMFISLRRRMAGRNGA